MNLIAPTSFRKGNTFLWKNAQLSLNKKSNRIVSSDLVISQSLLGTLTPLVKRSGINVLGGSVSKATNSSGLRLHLLYCPKYKFKVSSRRRRALPWMFRYGLFRKRGEFMRWPEHTLNFYYRMLGSKLYRYNYRNVVERQHYLQLNNRPGKLNRLITRNTLRGSARFVKGRRRFGRKYYRTRPHCFKIRYKKYLSYYSKYHPLYRRPWLRKIRGKRIKLPPRRYPMRWYVSKYPLKISKYRMSEKLSSSLGKPVQISAENILGYIAKKNKSSFWMHQQYAWAGPYRRFRRHYSQYFDILNAFYLLAVFRGYNSILAHYFLNIITRPLRKTYKIKRYFGFLSSVINNYHWTKRQFSVFKLILAGKFTGGTKRTKLYSIGYGQLIWQTISENAMLHFRSFDHKFGEFGLKLFTTRRDAIKPSTPTHRIFGINIRPMRVRKPKPRNAKKKIKLSWSVRCNLMTKKSKYSPKGIK